MKKILITGGSGFIGSNLVKYFSEKSDYKVFYTGKEDKFVHNNATKLSDNFQNLKNIKDIDILFHMAAITNTLEKDESKMFAVNTYDALNLFEKVITLGCKKIIYASSCAVYGNIKPPFKEDGTTNPLNSYAESKLELDNLAKKLYSKDLSIIGLRFSNVYGEGEDHKGKSSSMIHQILNNFKNDKNTNLFKWGEQKRDFVYINDIININLCAMKSNISGIFNAGSGNATSFNEIFKIFCQQLKRDDLEINYIDNEFKESYQNYTLCDMTLSKNKLNFVSKWDIESGICDFIIKSGVIKETINEKA